MTAKFYRVPEVAAILGCGRTTIYSLIKTGRLKAVHVAGCRRVAAQDLDAYIARIREGE